MTPRLPTRLPCELIDEIIDIFVCNDNKTHCVALASRRCRERVYKQTFSKINVDCGRAYRLFQLASLLNGKVWPPQDALHHFIRSVIINIVYKPSIPSDDIITILGTIFCRDRTQAVCSLSITGEDRHLDDKRGLSFESSLGSEVVLALQNLFHGDSCIQELRLANVWDVPPFLLFTSSITHLHLTNVHFHGIKERLEPSILPLSNLQNLFMKNLATVPSSSLFEDLVQEWREQRPKFQLNFEVFETVISQVAQLESTSKLGANIGTLIIHTFSECIDMDDAPAAVNYGQVQVLKCAEINLEVTICTRAPASDDSDTEDQEEPPDLELVTTPQRPIFLSILNMLPNVLPPELRVKMDINIDWYNNFESSHEALDDLYSALYHPSMLECLQGKSVDGNDIRAVFNLDIVIFLQCDDMDEEDLDEIDKEEYGEHLCQLFGSLTCLEGVEFIISVTFCP